MTIPCNLFEGTSSGDARRAYAAIFRAPLRAERPSHPVNRTIYASLRTRQGWRPIADPTRADPAAGSTVALTLSDTAEGRRVFDALAQGGEVERPYGPTAWSEGYGRLTDRWGTHWMLDTLPPPRGGA